MDIMTMVGLALGVVTLISTVGGVYMRLNNRIGELDARTRKLIPRGDGWPPILDRVREQIKNR